MKINNNIMILLLFAAVTVKAQTEFVIGFRGETALMQYEIDGANSVKATIPFIQNLYFPVGLKFNENLQIDLRPGYMFASGNYEGIELGAFLAYYFSHSDFFLSGGITFHFNHDTDGNEGFYGNTISLVSGGVGYSLGENVGMELSFHYPLDSNYGFHGDIDYQRNIEYNIKWISKLGMMFWF